LRAKGMLFQERDSGMVSNLYSIKLVNKTRRAAQVEMKPGNFRGKIELLGRGLSTKSENISMSNFFVYLYRKDIHERKTKLKIVLYSEGKKIRTVSTSFLGPVSQK
jgi:hypothetical protein